MGEPAIDLWYGDRQCFGDLGRPQRWINILGTVRGDGLVDTLSYSLNGAPAQPLKLGPDGKRLVDGGDFNAEIDVSLLQPGRNMVTLAATSQTGGRVSRQVEVIWRAAGTWPLPYSIDFSQVDSIGKAVQIVDGRWRLSDQGIRPVVVGYDRLVALGDVAWQDYQIAVNVTFHGFARSQDHPRGGFGILMRWSGHYADQHQPSREWRPNGAIAWYRARWEDDPPHCRCLNISDAVVQDRIITEADPLELAFDVPYVFRIGVRSRRGRTSEYHFQAWPAGQDGQLLCDLTAEGVKGEAPRGSILLIALFADVTIGNMTVEPL